MYPLSSFPVRRFSLRFFALTLSYLLLVAQLAPLAHASGPRHLAGETSTSGENKPQSAEINAATMSHAQPTAVPVPLLFAPSITATKTDALAPGGDVNMNGLVDPGDTLQYTITINNAGPDAATNLTLGDTVDPNTSIVAGSPDSTPIAFTDTYNVIGNVRIQPNAAQGVLTNDINPETGNNTNLTVSGPTTGPTNGQATVSADGSFNYNPNPGFTGTDSFTYTITDTTGESSTGTVSLNVGNGNGSTTGAVIWFVDDTAAAGGDGRLTSPFNCYTGPGASCFSTTAADDPGDFIFLFDGTYTGGYQLLNNEGLIGQDATAMLASLTGVTVQAYSNALPATDSVAGGVSITTTAPATNAIPLGQTNLLRGFTVGNTTGAKIVGSNFGTLTVGNNATPDVTLNGTGQALGLTNGTLLVTGGLTSVTTSSSTAQGIFLSQVADSDGAGGSAFSFGSTTVSGSTTQGIQVQQSTADINFGNTAVGTGVAGSGGTNAVSLQNNSMGTRTFGTLTIQNINGPANSAFLNSGGGNTVAGTTSISGVAGTGHGIDIQSLATGTSVSFGNTTVNKASAGSLVNLASNVGNVLFLSLGGTNTNGAGLTGTENSGSITVTNNTGSLTTTSGPAVSITKAGAPATPITLNFTALSSTNSGSQGVNLDRVNGNLTTGTTTVTNSTGTAIQVQNTSAGGTMTFGTTSAIGSGNANVDAPGTGVFLNANAAAVTFADLDILPDANERALHATNNTGAITTTSGDIAATGNVTLEIVGLSLVRRPRLTQIQL